jgi:hypothetical protein
MPNAHWNAESLLRPDFVSDPVWNQIYANFQGVVNDPLLDLPGALQEEIDRLSDMGFSEPSDLQAF